MAAPSETAAGPSGVSKTIFYGEKKRPGTSRLAARLAKIDAELESSDEDPENTRDESDYADSSDFSPDSSETDSTISSEGESSDDDAGVGSSTNSSGVEPPTGPTACVRPRVVIRRRNVGGTADVTDYMDYGWMDADNDNFILHPFTGSPGVSGVQRGASVYECFRSLLSENFLQKMVDETNDYEARQEVRHKRWYAVTSNEFLWFFGVIISMSQCIKPNVKDYWNVGGPFETPFFREAMARNRFFDLQHYFHFINDDLADKNDKLRKLRPVIEEFNAKYSERCVLSKDISIDESLMKSRARLSYIQYIPSKRARFGVKFYKLCQSGNGYCWKFTIYSGKAVAELGQDTDTSTARLVKYLCAGVENKGHTLYLDNFYTSPKLFKDLHSEDAVGLECWPSSGETARMSQLSVHSIKTAKELQLQEEMELK